MLYGIFKLISAFQLTKIKRSLQVNKNFSVNKDFNISSGDFRRFNIFLRKHIICRCKFQQELLIDSKNELIINCSIM